MTTRPTTVFIDADDTLWFDEVHFTLARRAVLALLSPDRRDSAVTLMEEMVGRCAPGEAGFASMISSCVRQLDLEHAILTTIDNELATFMQHPVRVLASARSVLEALSRCVSLVLYTKGIRGEQERKLHSSG